MWGLKCHFTSTVDTKWKTTANVDPHTMNLSEIKKSIDFEKTGLGQYWSISGNCHFLIKIMKIEAIC